MDELLQALKIVNNSNVLDEIARFLFNLKTSLVKVGFSQSEAHDIIVGVSRNLQQQAQQL